jgi:hypothetical protein
MDWKAARSKLTPQVVDAAAEWVDEHCRRGDFANLYERTGCHPARHRYVEYRGQRIPSKAFGYLVLVNAGWNQKEDYRPTVNEVISPLRRFGVKDAPRGLE